MYLLGVYTTIAGANLRASPPPTCTTALHACPLSHGTKFTPYTPASTTAPLRARENAVEGMPLNDMPRYHVVQIKVKLNAKNRIFYDKQKNIMQTKLHTKVDFLSKPLDLSAALGVGSDGDTSSIC